MTNVKFTRKPFDNGFNSIVDGLFSELPVFFNNEFNKLQGRVTVPVNVKESDKAYQLEVVAPGFEKTDFTINLEQNILTITGKKEVVKENTDGQATEKQLRTEFNFKGFKRSFTLDEKIDATSIDALYINGILQVTLPKKVEVKAAPTQITIK